MRYGRLIVGVVLGMATMSSQAVAQETRQLKIGLRADVTRDTNVTASSKSQAALRGLTPEDTVFTPSLTFDALAPIGRQSLFLKGSAGYVFHDVNKRLDRESIDVTGGLNGRFGPCIGQLSVGYIRGLSQVDDPRLLLAVENIQDVKRAKVDVGCSRETGFGVTFGASEDRVSNDLQVLQDTDSNATAFTVGVGYKRPAFGTLSLFGSFGTVEYPNRVSRTGYDLTSIGLTYDRQLGARIQGSVTAAHTTIDPTGPSPAGVGSSDLKSVTYSGKVTYRASSRLRLQASVDRDVTPATGLGGSYDISNGYRLNGDYDLSSRINIAVGGWQVERSSKGVLPIAGIALTEADTKTVYGAVRYKQSERLSFVLNIAHEERTTNAPQFDYTSDRIGLAADVTF